jgi:hypothetical protein
VAGARVYIRGHADSLAASFQSKVQPFECNNEEWSDIKYLKAVDTTKQKFSEQSYPWKIQGVDYGNKDLPYLRARFLQCKYHTIFQETPAEILEGNIDPNINEFSRNGTLLLYIPVIQPN